MGHLEQRRPHEIEHEINVHRPVRRISRRTHGIGETEATENLHRPRISALPFWVAERRLILFNQDAADTALAEIDTECEADRAGPNDKNFRVHTCLIVATFPVGQQSRLMTVAPERLTTWPYRRFTSESKLLNSST